MSKDLNITAVIGRLVADVEVRYSNTGVALGKFSIANNDDYTKDGQKVENVSYFTVKVFGNTATVCQQYLTKGDQVCVEGKLKQERWQDQAGNNKSIIVISASKVQFLQKRQGVGSNTPPQPNNGVPPHPNNPMPRQAGPTGNVQNPWDNNGGSGYNDDIPF